MDAQFTVKYHFAVTGRGAFVGGELTAGSIQIGDRVAVPSAASSFTVNAIEFADNISSRESFVCIRFAEDPSKEILESLFPVGSMIQITNAA